MQWKGLEGRGKSEERKGKRMKEAVTTNNDYP